MFNFVPLLLNEGIKMQKRPRTWVIVGIIGLLSLVLPIIIGASPLKQGASLFAVIEYTMMFTGPLVTIFIVFSAADSVASEFSKGTIKLLLIRPWSRLQVLASKLIANIILSIALILLQYGAAIISTYLFFWKPGIAINPLLDVELIWNNQPSLFEYLAIHAGFTYIYAFALLIIAFTMSSVFRSGMLAITGSLFIYFTHEILGFLLLIMNKSWTKLLIFEHLDLRSKVFVSDNDISDLVNQSQQSSLGFSVFMLSLYIVILLSVAAYVFNKRDVAT